jgi:hypothetical protein
MDVDFHVNYLKKDIDMAKYCICKIKEYFATRYECSVNGLNLNDVSIQLNSTDILELKKELNRLINEHIFDWGAKKHFKPDSIFRKHKILEFAKTCYGDLKRKNGSKFTVIEVCEMFNERPSEVIKLLNELVNDHKLSADDMVITPDTKFIHTGR